METTGSKERLQDIKITNAKDLNKNAQIYVL